MDRPVPVILVDGPRHGEDVQRAIAGLNGKSLDGRPLTVNEARPPRNDFSRPRSGSGGGGGGRDNFSRRRDY